jgi:hypothetical protein
VLLGGIVLGAEASKVRHGSSVRLSSGGANDAEVSSASLCHREGACDTAVTLRGHCNGQINQIF